MGAAITADAPAELAAVAAYRIGYTAFWGNSDAVLRAPLDVTQEVVEGSRDTSVAGFVLITDVFVEYPRLAHGSPLSAAGSGGPEEEEPNQVAQNIQHAKEEEAIEKWESAPGHRQHPNRGRGRYISTLGWEARSFLFKQD